MTSIALKTEEMEWQKGSPLYGPQSIFRGEETVALKVLSDRRAEGGGLALLIRMRPPRGKLIKIVAIARSDEHIFALADGRTNKAGHKLRFSGDYRLNPDGQPHSAIIAEEDIALVIYTGEPDELLSLEILDRHVAAVEPAALREQEAWSP
jgi:hypothetical protein